MAKIRVGLLGAGYIMAVHARALRNIESVELIAVCDQSVGRARAAADRFGIPQVFDSIDALAASDCDCVHVLLPPSLHVTAAQTLLEHGKHVFLEKPMGTAADACQSLAEEAGARGLRLGVNHNFLFTPRYEALRARLRDGVLGPADYLTLNWLMDLPLLRFGPFDAWMVREPRNLMLEVGSHLAAFAIDLLGEVRIDASHASNPVELPGGARVFRHWTAVGTTGPATVAFNLSLAPGRVDRSLHLRTLGGVEHVDFDKGTAWSDANRSANPILDNHGNARSAARALGAQARADLGRFLYRTVRGGAAANPFEDGLERSLAAFYDPAGGDDPRHDGRFGASVIALCEAIVSAAGITAPVPATSVEAVPVAAAPTRADILVVGGTGFIGRGLVRRLLRDGRRVRVLTRNAGAARIEFGALPVEIVEGTHDDDALLDVALDGIEIVYHLAKSEGKRWADYLAGDVGPTRALALASLRAGVHRFVYTGTIDSYASAALGATITGDTPLDRRIGSRNLYARAKAAGEALLRDLWATRGLPLVILRPGIVIGEASPPDHLGVADFVSPTQARFWGDGRNKLPFVLVDDVVEALALAATVPGIEGRSFLVADAPLLSARDYVEAVGAEAGMAIAAEVRPAWRSWLADAGKEAVKHLLRHPNRRASTLHDWSCKAHRATFDAAATREALGWRPAGTKERLIAEGIGPSVRRFMR